MSLNDIKDLLDALEYPSKYFDFDKIVEIIFKISGF